MYAPPRNKGYDPEDFVFEDEEVQCPRCKGTCADRHGEDCLHCDGMGTILL